MSSTFFGGVIRAKPTPILKVRSISAVSSWPYWRKILKTLGIKAFRFSIEWSRIEPTQGTFNDDEINHYVDKANKLISNDIHCHPVNLCKFIKPGVDELTQSSF